MRGTDSLFLKKLNTYIAKNSLWAVKPSFRFPDNPKLCENFATRVPSIDRKVDWVKWKLSSFYRKCQNQSDMAISISNREK